MRIWVIGFVIGAGCSVRSLVRWVTTFRVSGRTISERYLQTALPLGLDEGIFRGCRGVVEKVRQQVSRII